MNIEEAVILSAQPQRNIPTIWATYDADKELSYRRFHLFTTGELIDNELLKKLKFIATIQQNRNRNIGGNHDLQRI